MEAVLSQSVYVTENKNMKKYMYKGKKNPPTHQSKTFGTLTVFQLWSIRSIGICLFVLWQGMINILESSKCCKRNHFPKKKINDVFEFVHAYGRGTCTEQKLD